MRNNKGFTLIELMVVVLIVGILAAIGMANYQRIRTLAMESSVKANMHNVQIMLENFATQNDGIYPLAADEPAFRATFPGGAYPDNPFTNNPTLLIWNAAPGNPGEIGLPTSTMSQYVMQGHGQNGLLTLVLTNG